MIAQRGAEGGTLGKPAPKEMGAASAAALRDWTGV